MREAGGQTGHSPGGPGGRLAARMVKENPPHPPSLTEASSLQAHRVWKDNASAPRPSHLRKEPGRVNTAAGVRPWLPECVSSRALRLGHPQSFPLNAQAGPSGKYYRPHLTEAETRTWDVREVDGRSQPSGDSNPERPCHPTEIRCFVVCSRPGCDF